MGSNQSAKNIIDLEMENIVNQVTSNIVNSSTKGGATNTINITDGCSLDNVKIDMNASFTASAESISKVMTDQQTKQAIETQMGQVAENITQTLSGNMTNAQTENITDLIQTVTTNMTNENISECISDVFAANTLNCSGHVEESTFDFNATADFVSKCYQEVEGRQALDNAISNIIDQDSKNTQEDTVTAGLNSIGSTLTGVITASTGPMIIIGIVALVFLMKGGKFIANGGPLGAIAGGGKAKVIIFILVLCVGAYLFFECTQWNAWCNKKEN